MTGNIGEDLQDGYRRCCGRFINYTTHTYYKECVVYQTGVTDGE